ncbi:lipoprotein signal peptidase [Caminibacter mediatlanticus TB-2]|uniref:Lipoprotein signal peptidase n=1 Tax=Caminibacter mediatlanticus TB-2 TaxID=391592 RepID=A0ABX5VA80_9BACT|nr:signal peptidase II [Caminibacter mediatlanticus]QCT94499.1 lipoprotein signal peptidase [Caminibacter mediatlanticus TB-2]
MKKIIFFIFAFFLIFLIDQTIKHFFLNGFEWHSKCISLVLAINKGVAFSMFSFLGEYLKYIQLFFIFLLFYFFIKEKVLFKHPIITGILFGAAISNLYDRFRVGGVVDYVYWHCFFDFAIFNFADVMIDLSILMFAYYYFFAKILLKK